MNAAEAAEDQAQYDYFEVALPAVFLAQRVLWNARWWYGGYESAKLRKIAADAKAASTTTASSPVTAAILAFDEAIAA